jgi:ABC-type glycerol-3-phosphate transport system substrate-binding protein
MLVLVLLAVVVLGGCAPPGSGYTGEGTVPTAVSTDVTAPARLILYDGAGLKAIDEALIAAFHRKHPNITITGRYDPDDVQAVNAPRVLASDNPPDVARIIALADVVKKRQLTNLDGYARLYGWGRLPEGQLSQYRVTPTGVRGTGAQYTVADGFTVTGFYYNKKLAGQVGLSAPPRTFDELAAVLAKAKAAGLVPMMAGNQTGQAVFAIQMLLNRALGVKTLNDWIYHVPNATINRPEAISAVEIADRWAKAGYFPADSNGTDSTGALRRFAQGEALFYPSGNWDASTLDRQMGENVGFFLPPPGSNGQLATMSDPLSNFGVPARSQHKDAAAAFLDFLLSPEARQIVVDAGFAPSGIGPAPRTTHGVKVEVQKAFAALVAANGQVQFVQNATNGISATWTSQAQLLVAGRVGPAEMLANLQNQYERGLRR